ncbi:hypothetical protein SFRURICE_005127, partial [Spodoptera frugiperda]
MANRNLDLLKETEFLGIHTQSPFFEEGKSSNDLSHLGQGESHRSPGIPLDSPQLQVSISPTGTTLRSQTWYAHHSVLPLRKFRKPENSPVILCPTRELAIALATTRP